MGTPASHRLSKAIVSTILCLLSTTVDGVKERCHPHDKKVLLSIKQSFNNAPHFSSWSTNTDCCRYWYKVKCDVITHRVISLEISESNTTTGTIPPAVGNLPFLHELTFHKLSYLTGTIPDTVANLQHLFMARFSFTSLSGPVPSFFHRLNNLYILDLAFNRFSGSIPPELALAPSLTSLRLDRNLLTGPIPDSFGYFKMAGKSPRETTFGLNLAHNRLSGPIPRSLGRLKTAGIDVSWNRLTGDASFLFRKEDPLDNMDLSRNKLSFNLSTVEIPMPAKWVVGIILDLSHNRIFGSIPSAGMENVYILDVSYNRLCGAIPNVGLLPTSDKECFIHNKCLCGPPLPACKT